MKTFKARLATTHVTRDGIRFTKEALECFLKRINESERIMPFNINHDFSRQIGFVVPKTARIVKMEDGELAVEADVNIYETQEEKVTHYVDVRQKEEKVTLKELNISCLKVDDTGGPTYYLPKPIFDILRIKPELNDDGLFVVRDPKLIFQKGILLGDKYIVKFHNFLRRAYSAPNAFNKRLFDKIRDVKIRNPQVSVAFLISPDAISLRSEFKEHLEFDYAWGPKLPTDLRKLKEGITQHVATDSDKLAENFERTDFWWHKDEKNLMALEIEELRDATRYLRRSTDKYFPFRYAHLQYDVGSDAIVHLDCALRIYPEKKYNDRLHTNDISKVSKTDCDRVKLLRLDGKIAPMDAFELLTYFFYNNSDVRSYFELQSAGGG